METFLAVEMRYEADFLFRGYSLNERIELDNWIYTCW
jgi:hypothetical protein